MDTVICMSILEAVRTNGIDDINPTCWFGAGLRAGCLQTVKTFTFLMQPVVFPL